jgi:predicted nucleic acid-binding protein
MSYLFDTDAIVELLSPEPAPAYVEWLAGIPREEQFTSAIVVGALVRAASSGPNRETDVAHIEERVLPAVTVLPYDASVALAYGTLAAQLAAQGASVADDDLKIAATALVHELSVVTGDLVRYESVANLSVCTVLIVARTL